MSFRYVFVKDGIFKFIRIIWIGMVFFKREDKVLSDNDLVNCYLVKRNDFFLCWNRFCESKVFFLIKNVLVIFWVWYYEFLRVWINIFLVIL